VEGDEFTFNGGVTSEADGRLVNNVGNFICDQYFGGGKIEGEIEFAPSSNPNETEAYEFILFYHPLTRGFYYRWPKGFRALLHKILGWQPMDCSCSHW
jgi:hypothetical protein